MKAKAVISHIFLALVLYNAMALGANQMMEEGAWMWVFMGLGSAFLLGMQLMLIVIECKGEDK